MRDEKAFIKQAVEAGKPVLGICLGAQLLADILGARVYENRHMEMGWFPVRAAGGENKPEFLEGLPDEITVFHWHSRTFDLPAGAVHLFESEGCKNQGFIYNGRVVALQFHPEVNEERIKSLIERFGDGMANGPFVQEKTGDARAGMNIWPAQRNSCFWCWISLRKWFKKSSRVDELKRNLHLAKI